MVCKRRNPQFVQQDHHVFNAVMWHWWIQGIIYWKGVFQTLEGLFVVGGEPKGKSLVMTGPVLTLIKLLHYKYTCSLSLYRLWHFCMYCFAQQEAGKNFSQFLAWHHHTQIPDSSKLAHPVWLQLLVAGVASLATTRLFPAANYCPCLFSFKMFMVYCAATETLDHWIIVISQYSKVFFFHLSVVLNG